MRHDGGRGFKALPGRQKFLAMPTMPTVLLTGALGFTARYVERELKAAGWRVMGMDYVLGEKSGYVSADLTDFDQVLKMVRRVKPRAVVHLAAMAFVGHDNPDAFYKVNLMGTRNLLDALDREGCGQDGIVLASSANIYGNAPHGRPIKEDEPPAPVNDYAVSKLAMEYMARLWQDKLPICLARPFNYTGVGQSGQFLIPKIVDHFKRRADTIELGNLDVYRDFSDVRFVARAYAGLLKAGPWGRAVNICSGTVYSIAEIIAMCQQISGHKLTVQQNPEFMRAHELKILLGDASRLKQFLPGLNAIELKSTLEWMLAG